MPQLTLVERTADGVGLEHLRFDAPLEEHSLPAQYTVVEVDGQRGFFALANQPGAPVELLVKRQGPVASWLCEQAPGSAVPMTPARGPGFAVPEVDRPLVVLAAGSGIAAARPLIEAELSRPLPRRIVLFYGLLTPDHASFSSHRGAWTRAGVEEHLVYDRPPPDGSGYVGFVQHAAREAGWVRDGVLVALVGFSQMIDEARAMWAAAGLDPTFVRTNF